MELKGERAAMLAGDPRAAIRANRLELERIYIKEELEVAGRAIRDAEQQNTGTENALLTKFHDLSRRLKDITK